MPASKVVTTQLPGDLSRRLDEVAGRLDRSKNWVVKAALEDWLAEEERRHELTLEALADVDSGRLTDQNAMMAWADKLKRSRRTKRPQ